MCFTMYMYVHTKVSILLTDILLQRREREIVQELETKEESALEIRETYSSLQEEVDLKTKKLIKVLHTGSYSHDPQ